MKASFTLKSLFLFFFALVFIENTLLYSQNIPPIQWQKSFGGTGIENATVILQTIDSGFITAGYSNSNDNDVSGNHGGYDYWIVKTNKTGDVQWQKSYGGSGDDVATDIKLTLDNGYIISGYSNSNDDDVSGNHGGYDYWIVKLNNTGNIVWQKSFGGSAGDFGYNIQSTKDSGFIVVGTIESNDQNVSENYGLVDCWIVKLNKVGSIQWQKNYGGSNYDYIRLLQVTEDSNYIVAGHTISNDHDLTTNKGNYDWWVLNINNTGSIIWQKSFGGSNIDWLTSLHSTKDGGYILSGETLSNDLDVSGNHGGFDYLVMKLKANGDLQWQKCYGGGIDDVSTSVQQTNDNGYIVCGFANCENFSNDGTHTDADGWILKLDTLGIVQNDSIYIGNNDDQPNSIIQTNDGGFAIGGYSNSDSINHFILNNQGNTDFWIMKLGTGDIILPVHLHTFTTKLNGKYIQIDWEVENELNFNLYEIERSSDGRIFTKIGAVKASNARDYEYTDNAPLPDNYYRLRLVDKDGKFTYSKVISVQFKSDNKFTIYPNPATTFVQLQFSETIRGKVDIEVSDETGKVVIRKSEKVGGALIKLSTVKLLSGIYSVKATLNGHGITKRLTINR